MRKVPPPKLLSQAQIRHSEISWDDILLSSIQNHPVHDDKNTSIKMQEYALRYVTGELSLAAYRLIELYHPILVVPAGKGKKEWECVAGFRTLTIARLVLEAGGLVTVGKLPVMGNEEKARMCYADLLLSPLAQSLKNPAKTLTRMLSIEDVAEKMVPVWLPRIAMSAANLASALGISPITLARAKKACSKENPSDEG